jgi:hypothetical protein
MAINDEVKARGGVTVESAPQTMADIREKAFKLALDWEARQSMSLPGLDGILQTAGKIENFLLHGYTPTGKASQK